MRIITTFVGAAVLALAGTASAQLDPSLVTGLSAGCASGLVGLVTNSSVSSCLALPSAVGALSSAGNTSVIPGLQSYLSNSICGSGKTACSTAQLGAANSTLLQTCGADLASNNGANIPALVYYFINAYDKLRNAGCLQNSAGESCLTNELYTLQNITQTPVTFTSIQSILSNQTTQQMSLQAVAANKTAFCTDCTHGVYSILFPTNSNQRLAAAVNQTCGASFLDAKIPSSLKSTAQGNSTSVSASTSPNSASPFNPSSALAASTLAAIAALTLL